MTVQDNINRLMWNKRHVLIPAEVEKPDDVSYLTVRDLTVEDRNLFLFLKRKEQQDAVSQEIPLEEDVLSVMRSSGNWTKQDDDILAKSDEHVQFLRSEMLRHNSESRNKSLQKQIDQTELNKRDVDSKRYDIYVVSAEYYAHEAASYSLIRRVVFDQNCISLWEDDTDFLAFKKRYFHLLIFIVHEVMSEGCMDIKDIREIARSPEWRLIWTLQRENLASLFDRSIGNFTINHKLLVYWSRLYDVAYESQEPPSQDIVQDDMKFDQWLANKELNKTEKSEARPSQKDHQEQVRILEGEYIEACVCGMKEKNIGKGLGEKMPHASSCSYGVFRRYSNDEKEKLADQVYGRNSTGVRTIMTNEMNQVDKVGVIDEKDLRTKKTRLALNMKQNVIPIHKK